MSNFRADIVVRDEQGKLVGQGTVPVDGEGRIDVHQFVRDAEHAAAAVKQDQGTAAAPTSGNPALDRLRAQSNSRQ